MTTYANKSKFAIIPIDPNDRFAVNKSENKLLSMWKLGLPTIFSNIPSYVRVSQSTLTTSMCLSQLGWKKTLADLMRQNISEAKLETNVDEYLRDTHSHDLLVEQWNTLLNKSLQENNV